MAFTDVKDILFDSTIRYDESFFVRLDRIVQTEPWLNRGRLNRVTGFSGADLSEVRAAPENNCQPPVPPQFRRAGVVPVRKSAQNGDIRGFFLKSLLRTA